MQATAQQLLLTDAHCHPQLDPANMQAVLLLQSSRLAAMSVSYDVDWDIMLQLHKLAGAWGRMGGATVVAVGALAQHSRMTPLPAPRQHRTYHAGDKVIPGFGIHPWWSHLHASSQGDAWPQLLEAPSQEQLQQALHILSHADPVTNSGEAQQQQQQQR